MARSHPPHVWLRRSSWLTIVSLIVFGAAAYRETAAVINSFHLVERSDRVLEQLQLIRVSQGRARDAIHNYLLSGDREYIHDGERFAKQVSGGLQELENLTFENAEQHQRAARLDSLMGQSLSGAHSVIAQYQKGETGTARDIMMSQEKGQIQRDIHQWLNAMEAEEHRTLDQRQTAIGIYFLRLTVVISSGMLLATCVVLLMIRFLRRETWRREQIEDDFERSTTRFQTLLNGADAGIYAVDEQDRCTFINKAGAAMLGSTPEDLIHQPTEDMFRPKESLFLRRDGAIVPAEYASFPIVVNGIAMGAVMTFKDIRERIKAEKDFRESQSMLESIIRYLPIALFIKDADDLSFVRCNQAGEALMGRSAKDLLGKRDHDFYPADVADLLAKKDRDVLESKKVSDVPLEADEAADGERFLRLRKIPIIDESGRPRYLLCTSEDMTEHVAAEREIQTQKAIVQAILYSLGEGLVVADTNGHILLCNSAAAKILGEFKIGDILPLVKAIHGEATHHVESRIKTSESPNGITLRINGRPIRNAQGELLGGVVAFENVTPQKNLEADLERAQESAAESARLKSEFAGNMTREIRTPIQMILAASGFLLDSPLPEEQRHFASTVNAAVKSILKSIQDLQNFTALEAGEIKFQSKEIHIRETVENVGMMFAEAIQVKGVELTFDIADDVPSLVQGDPERLREILGHLVSNAAVFTSHGEVLIRVSVEVDKKDQIILKFAVRDTGIGISKGMQPRIFSPFVKTGSPTAAEFGRTGLGLAISKGLVERMGGVMGMASVLGEGSEFWFTAMYKKPTPVPVMELKPRSEWQGMRVLVVDGHETTRKSLVHQAALWGMRSQGASNAQDALDQLHAAAESDEPFDIALIDVRLAGADGLSLARAIKLDLQIGRIKLMILKPIEMALSHDSLVAAGVNTFLVKPIRQSHLFDAFTHVVSAVPRMVDPSHSAQRALLETPEASQPVYPRRLVRLLVAEDNPINQEVARYQLEKLGYKPDLVASGQAAVEAHAKYPYDVILMDCQMPGLSGYQATSEIRRMDGALRHTPIIAMASNALERDEKTVRQSGMDDVLAKPVKAKDLEALLVKVAPTYVTDPPAINLEQLRVAIPHDAAGVHQWVALYVKDTKVLLERLKSAIARHDSAEVSRIARDGAKTGARYSMEGMAKILRQIDQKGQDKTLENCDLLLAKASTEFNRIQIYLCSALEHASKKAA